jgi:4'-phosphopantetheinyl transferase EntD
MEQINKLAAVPARAFRREFQKTLPKATEEINVLMFSIKYVPKETFPLTMSTLLFVAAEIIQKNGNTEKMHTTIRKRYITRIDADTRIFMLCLPP